MYGKIISKFPQFCQLKEENQKQDLNFLVYSSLSATIDLRTWSGPNIPYVKNDFPRKGTIISSPGPSKPFFFSKYSKTSILGFCIHNTPIRHNHNPWIKRNTLIGSDHVQVNCNWKLIVKKNWAGPRASPNANSLVHDLHLKIESIIFLKICELFFWSKRQHTLLIMLTFCVPVAKNSTYNFIAPRI